MQELTGDWRNLHVQNIITFTLYLTKLGRLIIIADIIHYVHYLINNYTSFLNWQIKSWKIKCEMEV